MSEEEQQPTIKSTPYASPMTALGGSIILLTNPENDLHNIELMFRGLEHTEAGELVRVGEELMNSTGVSKVIGMAKSTISQTTNLSNLRDKDIEKAMDFLGDTLAKFLMHGRKKYDIKLPTSRDVIYYTILNKAYICMKRALDEGERRFWKGSQQEITTRVEGQKRSGLMENLIGWGKG